MKFTGKSSKPRTSSWVNTKAGKVVVSVGSVLMAAVIALSIGLGVTAAQKNKATEQLTTSIEQVEEYSKAWIDYGSKCYFAVKSGEMTEAEFEAICDQESTLVAEAIRYGYNLAKETDEDVNEPDQPDQPEQPDQPDIPQTPIQSEGSSNSNVGGVPGSDGNTSFTPNGSITNSFKVGNLVWQNGTIVGMEVQTGNNAVVVTVGSNGELDFSNGPNASLAGVTISPETQAALQAEFDKLLSDLQNESLGPAPGENPGEGVYEDSDGSFWS